MCEISRLQGERLLAVMVYPNSHNTEVRTSLSLRSTARGANNRLDARGVLCVDRADGSTNPILSECCGLRTGQAAQTLHQHGGCTTPQAGSLGAHIPYRSCIVHYSSR